MTYDEVMAELRARSDPARVIAMARYAVPTLGRLGVSVPSIREVGRLAGKDHDLAERLWQSGIHEAMIAASLVDRTKWVDEAQMDRWVVDFDSWDVCDQVCMGLFSATPFADKKIFEWAVRPEEYVKRAAFAMIAGVVVHDKKASDERLACYFPLISAAASDERNFVKKAVNWALRQIGKRNANLLPQAIAVAEEIGQQPSKSARWIAADALRELRARQARAAG